MLPYKVQTVHELVPARRRTRLTYFDIPLNLVQEKDGFVSEIIMCDETQFH